VTQGKANYVRDPYDALEWIRVMQTAENHIGEVDFARYDQVKLTEKYFSLLKEMLGTTAI
jgi:hypothetical protein